MRNSQKKIRLGYARVRSEQGQALAEYIILVVIVSLALIPFFKVFPEAIRGYVRPFYYCISRPLP